MSLKIKKIFGKEKGIIIGAIHFPPLLGYADFPGFDVALENALDDLKAFEAGGADAVIIENNYDIPHRARVGPEVVASLAYLGGKIKASTRLPVGISVLWNDYKTALSVARVLGLDFIRVPVFVDTVETSYGIMEGDPADVIHFRKSIGAENVALFTDIHVKHSKIISKHTVAESARLAMDRGSDALIVTGKWTGDAPDVADLKAMREVASDFPIFCGSGADKDNVKVLFTLADGAIVSTSVKSGKNDDTEINLRPYSERIDEEKVLQFVKNSKLLK
jgi:uncharacterized protein